jgi:hypothetical protein
MYLEPAIKVRARSPALTISLLLFGTACDEAAASKADDPGPDASAVAPGLDAATAAEAGTPFPLCQVPLDCKAVDTLFLALRPCCSSAIRCGYELTRPEQLRGAVEDPDAARTPDNPDGLCITLDSIFRSPKSPDEKRVEVPGGEPIFYTPECETRAIVAYPFNGCCMPSGECGLATDVAFNSIAVLALPSASPLTRVECTTAAKLNAAFLAAPSFAGFAHLKETGGRCDYAGLAARLPHVVEAGESP